MSAIQVSPVRIRQPAIARHRTSARDWEEPASATGATPESTRLRRRATTEAPPATRGAARTASELDVTQSASGSDSGEDGEEEEEDAARTFGRAGVRFVKVARSAHAVDPPRRSSADGRGAREVDVVDGRRRASTGAAMVRSRRAPRVARVRVDARGASACARRTVGDMASSRARACAGLRRGWVRLVSSLKDDTCRSVRIG